MTKAQNNIPTIFIVFGATGDLMSKKIAPSLFHLYRKEELPSMFKVVGFSRQDLGDAGFQTRIAELLGKRPDTASHATERAAFTEKLSYVQGQFDQAVDYHKLAVALKKIDDEWGVCTNKLFYLAVAPGFYDTIFEHLAASGLTKPCAGVDQGWTRVIVEKPFGKDLATAEELDRKLAKLFQEDQIYRIDHYLAKEMLQNILAFRFQNNLFENNWSNELIESVELRLLESIGVEDRGSFYDGVGTLKDVGQNHLLQMLSLIAMDRPERFEADEIRRKRAEILAKLVTPTEDEIRNHSMRAQYSGYSEIKGVASGSKTETYFQARAFLATSRWQGVPFLLEAGKRLGEARKEIVVNFRDKKNRVTFRMEPTEGITIEFWSKKPGLKAEIEERRIDWSYREKALTSQYTEEYEKLLIDCVRGDQTLFVSTPELQAMWRFVDPIIEGWRNDLAPLEKYKPDTLPVHDPGTVAGMTKQIGLIGLGKMGAGLARNLLRHGWHVQGFNRSPEGVAALRSTLSAADQFTSHATIPELIKALPSPRIVWLMVPAGAPVDELLFGSGRVAELLSPGDIVIDGGNSFWKDAAPRAEKLKAKGIRFIDVGTSGGPKGALEGACLMIGGDREAFTAIEPLFRDLAIPGGYEFFEGAGAGHFVKMVHNGIEYGMMQAIGEGFEVMKASAFNLDLTRVAKLYNHGSVIESRLIGWTESGFNAYGEALESISPTVAHTGEGEWTVKTAKELGVPVPIIEGSFEYRVASAKNPRYTGKVLSMLRNQFGGHAAKK